MAVAHGGWRGILGGIVQQAGIAMTGPPGGAVIGPSIGPCCFTVGREVADAFAGRFGAGVVFAPRGRTAPRGWICGSPLPGRLPKWAYRPTGWPTPGSAPSATTISSIPTAWRVRSPAATAASSGPGRREYQRRAVPRNLAATERRIDAACARAGRGTVPRLLMATKYLDVEEMGVLAQAGIGLVGENRANGLEERWDRWKDSFEFHFIGHLQSRKVRQVVPYVSLIHSVESISLVEELDRRADTEVRVLLEVNVSGEETKYGILPAAAETFLERAAAHRRVRFTGLMTMAPLTPDPESTRPYFRELRELRDRLAVAFAGRYELTELSMGMSNDYEVAVEEGATIVRIGSALLSDA